MRPPTANFHEARRFLGRWLLTCELLVIDGRIARLRIRVPCPHNVPIFVIALLAVRLQSVLRPENRRWGGAGGRGK